MAAYAALVSLARLIDQIMSQDQDYAFLGDKEQMKSLLEKVIWLQEFLEDISVRSRSSTVDALEGRIRDVAYQLDCIVESTICRLIDHEFGSDTAGLSTSGASAAKTFSRWLGSIVFGTGGSDAETGSYPSASMAPVSFVFSSCIVEIDIILEEATEMKNIPVKKHKSTRLQTTSSASIAKVHNVGLNNEITKILDTITGRASNLQIVPITGMGVLSWEPFAKIHEAHSEGKFGLRIVSPTHDSATNYFYHTLTFSNIGKTTLARAVYDDSRTQHHFVVRFWVTISQEYDVRAILRGLLPSEPQTKYSDDRLIEHVYKNLKGRRFLIVLDDMWHGKAWDGVMNALPDDNNGSRIILTTRELGVVSYVGSLGNVHKMELLNDDQSWSMLREKVYGREPCPAKFEGIGRTISKNCKGLPLAIVVIAGLLKSNMVKGYWKEVAKSTNVAATTDYDHLFGILSLSYTNLPPQLKACFLYVGSFPEDYVFRTKELVMLWTAEGFLKPKESKTMEETAEECLEELVERSLFLVNKKTYNGKIKTFNIHDLLREVSIRKAKEEKYLHHYSTSVQNIIKARHGVSFYKNDLINFQSDTYNAHVRSFSYNSNNYDPVFGALCKISNFRYLSVVGYDGNSILTFPKSISKLQNLETLIIRYPMSSLPLDIWKLPRLRHCILETKVIGGTGSKFLLPRGQGGCYPVLESLQTLYGIVNVHFGMDVIERIGNVKKLRLEYNTMSMKNKDVSMEVFSLSNLRYLQQLEVLSIRCWAFRGHFGLPPSTDLTLPENLKRLSLLRIKIPLGKEYMSVVGLLPNLEVLKLEMVLIVGNIWEPNEGEFLELKCLKMDQLKIEEWRAESVHFPCLQKLEIIRCKKLKEVPESIGEIETLQEIMLGNCFKAKQSVMKIQENQQAFGNDSLKISIMDRYPKR